MRSHYIGLFFILPTLKTMDSIIVLAWKVCWKVQKYKLFYRFKLTLLSNCLHRVGRVVTAEDGTLFPVINGSDPLALLLIPWCPRTPSRSAIFCPYLAIFDMFRPKYHLPKLFYSETPLFYTRASKVGNIAKTFLEFKVNNLDINQIV